jgi:hypothetical protein
MLCLYIRLLRFLGVQVYPVGAAHSGGFSRTGDSFHNLQGHIIPILCNAAKGVLRLFYSVGLEVYADTIKPPYMASHKVTKSKQARTTAGQVYIIHFNLLKFFINFLGQI